jgi:hypothetical protein
VLREGGDLKITLEERDKTIDSLRERLNEATSGLASVRKVIVTIASRSKYEVDSLKAEQEALKAYIKETMLSKMSAMISDATSKISSKAAIVVDEATKILLAKYRYEVQQRKLLFNKLQELKGKSWAQFVRVPVVVFVLFLAPLCSITVLSQFKFHMNQASCSSI